MGTPSQNNLNLSRSDSEDDMEQTNYDRTPSTPESSNAPKETRGKAKGMSDTPNTKKKVWLILDHLEQPCHPLAEERINEDMSANSGSPMTITDDAVTRVVGKDSRGRCWAMGPGVNKTAMKSMEPILDQNYHLAEENSKLWKETRTNQMNFAMQLEEIRSTILRQQEPSTTNSFGTSSSIPRSSNTTSPETSKIGKEVNLLGGWPLDIVATGCVKEVDPTYKFHERHHPRRLPLAKRSHLMRLGLHQPTKDAPQEQGIPTLITWTFGGNTVAVQGSWDNWTSRRTLQRSGKDHSILMVLPSGIYQYRLLVDGDRRYIPDLPCIADDTGLVDNLLDVHDYVPENFEGIAEFEPPPSPDSSYGHTFPGDEDFLERAVGRSTPPLHLTFFGT
ncbi:hypothetical protein IFM89_037321 [Coptis chinensis]|uniref:AMP-activated protein kinase glycogen-binding domain-containing protein n=1 Tax=Coptis chinensis TaxID=261450 RepID=A0A835HSK5_9MAGN|nr:hypothetical protein IFM89_037321 [Coptis chinensis]